MHTWQSPPFFGGFLKGTKMQIEVSTDNSITGSDALTTHIKGLVQHELAYLDDHLTRVEVHLSDINAGKAGPDDIHCMLEARLKGHQPVVVKDAAESLDLATKSAARRLKSALESIVGKQSDRR
jgi:hypothetical protein